MNITPFQEVFSIPELFPSLCIEENDLMSTLYTIRSLNGTYKDLHLRITSAAYYQVLVKLPLFKTINVPQNAFISHCFKTLNCWEINKPLVQEDDFRGALYGKAFATESGVELFDLEDSNFSFILENDPIIKNLTIPTEVKGSPKVKYRKVVDCSDKYVALYEGNEFIHIFSSKNQAYLSTFQIEGEVKHLKIKDDNLFVREKVKKEQCTFEEQLRILNLVTHKIDKIVLADVEACKKIKISGGFLDCFGEKCLLVYSPLGLQIIYYDDFKHLKFPCQRELIMIIPHIIPDKDGFIIVSSNPNLTCHHILRLDISNGECKTSLLAKNVYFLSNSFTTHIKQIFCHSNRLFLSVHSYLKQKKVEENPQYARTFQLDENDIDIKIISFDLNTKRIDLLHSIPRMQANNEQPFQPIFFASAHEINYLVLDGLIDSRKTGYKTMARLFSMEYGASKV